MSVAKVGALVRAADQPNLVQSCVDAPCRVAPADEANSATRAADTASTATRRPGTKEGLLDYRLSKTLRSSSSLPGSRIASTWSPGWSVVDPTAISAWPPRITEI